MISCVCITHSREHLIGEAVESFLRQDYKGEKELIIVNDNPLQELVCDSKDVFILNSKKRFKTIGEKRNASIALSSGNIIFPWDDDDIYFPTRISYSLENIKGDYFNPRTAWVMNSGIKVSKNRFHSMSCFTRELFDSVGGYPHVNSGQDAEIENLFMAKQKMPIDSIDEKDLYYLYRWSGTNSWHLSACGVDSITGKNGMDMFAESNGKKSRAGLIEIKPSWKQDYISLVNENRSLV
jgi:glycosyltransferase involved in cell wall biosynthesis